MPAQKAITQRQYPRIGSITTSCTISADGALYSWGSCISASAEGYHVVVQGLLAARADVNVQNEVSYVIHVLIALITSSGPNREPLISVSCMVNTFLVRLTYHYAPVVGVASVQSSGAVFHLCQLNLFWTQ